MSRLPGNALTVTCRPTNRAVKWQSALSSVIGCNLASLHLRVAQAHIHSRLRWACKGGAGLDVDAELEDISVREIHGQRRVLNTGTVRARREARGCRGGSPWRRYRAR